MCAMDRLSPDTILSSSTLSSCTYFKLVSLLSQDDSWKKITEIIGIFSSQDIQDMSRSREPAEKLVLELSARLCTIEFFCNILEECGLYNILALFKGHEPLSIIEQPNNGVNDKMIIRGAQLNLSCKAKGLPLPKYQWYCDNVELKSCGDSISFNDFGLENEGHYYCIVSQEGYGSISSIHVNISLAPEKPEIIKQPPASVISNIGSKIILDVAAKGHPSVKYQWFKGNTQLDGCNENKLSLIVKNETCDGSYRCYIFNSVGEVWSNESTISVPSTPRPQPSAKVALLIANHIYDNHNCLNAPQNDVKTLTDGLLDLGFHTVALQNLNLTEMKNIIHYFASILPQDAYVVFYFSGHGFEICDKFMLPVDAPGPEDYLRINALCERELLRTILSSQPKLFVELLDMCLKPPNRLNKKILKEKTSHYEYEANNDLIQGYATTSYLGAYEKKTDQNGLYVTHLKEYLLNDREMPIVEMLRNVAKDVAKVCPIQKPFFGANVTMDYRLTDQCHGNWEFNEKLKALSLTPPDFVLSFRRLNLNSKVCFTPFLGVFLNTLEMRFTNLKDFKVSCEALGEELQFELCRIHGNVVIKVMNIQRLVYGKVLTLWLTGKDCQLKDYTTWDIGKPLIAPIDLWCKKEETRVFNVKEVH